MFPWFVVLESTWLEYSVDSQSMTTPKTLLLLIVSLPVSMISHSSPCMILFLGLACSASEQLFVIIPEGFSSLLIYLIFIYFSSTNTSKNGGIYQYVWYAYQLSYSLQKDCSLIIFIKNFWFLNLRHFFQ